MSTWSSDQTYWYENTDGQGTFGPGRVISMQGGSSVRVADVDGDGDVDVLTSSFYSNLIAWYPNTDGHGMFGPQRVINDQAVEATMVFAADLDSDGDVDALSSGRGGVVAWYENTDGQGTFSPELRIADNLGDANAIYAADVDDDGDNDVIATSKADDDVGTVMWFENMDGRGAFGPAQVITTEGRSEWICAADLDGDADLDVIPGFITGGIYWYEYHVMGDVNDDRLFDSGDLVQVFRAGEYEDDVEDNSGWEEGDWNGDGDFDSSDLVEAFKGGQYERESQAATSKIAAAVDWLFAHEEDVRRARAFVA